MVTPPVAPCGTVSAYRRHLRHNETPCAECREAKAEQGRSERKKRAVLRRLDATEKAASFVPPELTRMQELEQQRDLLHKCLHDPELDPRYVTAISKELRAVWAEIDELGKGENGGLGSDPLELIVGGASVVPFSSA